MAIQFFILSLLACAAGSLFMFGRDIVWEMLSIIHEVQGVHMTRTERWDRKQKAAGLACFTASGMLGLVFLYFTFFSAV